ncbi:MAG: alanine:cation symporter family protein, partial [Gemmatimonadota bacterium]
YTGVPVLAAVSRSGLPGDPGGPIVAVGLVPFALSTILAWAHYGERAAEYLFGHRATTPFRALFVAAAFAGGVAVQVGGDSALALLWGASGLAGGLMAIPNLVGILLLSGVVARETTRLGARRPGP